MALRALSLAQEQEVPVTSRDHRRPLGALSPRLYPGARLFWRLKELPAPPWPGALGGPCVRGGRTGPARGAALYVRIQLSPAGSGGKGLPLFVR